MVAYIAGKLNVKINYYDEKSHIVTFKDHLLIIVWLLSNYLL